MTKPIEFTRKTETETRYWITITHEERNSACIVERVTDDATPSDLVAALTAMPVSEREEVLREFDAGDQALRCNLAMARDQRDAETIAVLRATARAEKAEAEITEVRRVLGVRENAVTASTAAWRMGEITAATVRAEKAERERDEARKELGTLHVERQAIAAALGLLPGERIGEGRLSVAARLACEERDSLRARLIAAESAAAAREPREYPLHQLSRWDGDAVVDVTGTRTRIVNEGRGAQSAIVDSKGSGPILADVLALAHRRGLL